MGTILFRFRQFRQGMWFLPAAFSLLAILSIAVAYWSAALLPSDLPFAMPNEAVNSVLTVLASSMLTVSVFALSTISSALATASQSATPRAVPLIIADRTAMTSVSVFVGAFMFAILGILGLSAGIYSQAGRLLLFAVSLGVVVIVVVALLRWIGKISSIGRIDQTIDKVEAAAARALRAAGPDLCFGCVARGKLPKQMIAVPGTELGYVRHIDLSRLQELAERHDCDIAIEARAGTYCAPKRPLALVPIENEELIEAVRNCFVVGDTRTFEQDPRFGLVVLSEIASRALSPAINDPGTAIAVFGALTRLLVGANRDTEDSGDEPDYPNVSMPAITSEDLMADAFRASARDGAAHIEVVQRLLASLSAIVGAVPALATSGKRMAHEVNLRAQDGLRYDGDRALAAETLKEKNLN